MYTQFLVGKSQMTGPVGRLVDGTIILKWTFEKQSVNIRGNCVCVSHWSYCASASKYFESVIEMLNILLTMSKQ